MPFTSVAQLPETFKGLPERGKRVAVQLMNAFEEQGLIGDGAVQKALNIMNQVYNQGAGTWGAVKQAGVGAGDLAGVAAALAVLKGVKDNMQEHRKNVGVSVGANAPMQNFVRTAAKAVDLPEHVKFAMVMDSIFELAFSEVPVVFNHRHGEKLAAPKIMTSAELMSAFPGVVKLACLCKFAFPMVSDNFLEMMNHRFNQVSEKLNRAKNHISELVSNANTDRGSIQSLKSELQAAKNRAAMAESLADAVGPESANRLNAEVRRAQAEAQQATSQFDTLRDAAESAIHGSYVDRQRVQDMRLLADNKQKVIDAQDARIKDMIKHYKEQGAGNTISSVVSRLADNPLAKNLAILGTVMAGVGGAYQGGKAVHKWIKGTQAGRDLANSSVGKMVPEAISSGFSSLYEDPKIPFFENVYKKIKDLGPNIASEAASKALPLIGLTASTVAAKALYDKYRHHQTYNNMMNLYPELNQEDPDRVSRTFNLLQNYAPTIAKDPIGAGGVVKNLVALPDALDTSLIKNLIDLEKGSGGFTKSLLDNMVQSTSKSMASSVIGGKSAFKDKND